MGLAAAQHLARVRGRARVGVRVSVLGPAAAQHLVRVRARAIGSGLGLASWALRLLST